jgi:hypothetical protein
MKLRKNLTVALLFVLVSASAQQREGRERGAAREFNDTLKFNYSVVPVRLNGSTSNRVNIGYAGDGYTADELVNLPGHVEKSVAYIESGAEAARPYTRYMNFFNIYRIDVESRESGINRAPRFGEEPTLVVDNSLGGSRDEDRLGWVDSRKAGSLFRQASSAIEPGTFHWHFVVLNNPEYHNSGGRYVVFSYNYGREIGLHEAGHGFHNLADEYYGKGEYTRDEPRQVNVTADPTGAKWSHWLGYVDSDTILGTVGVYEGAIYADKGAYRPTPNSKMGWTSDRAPASFNAICREKVILDIYDIVDPADSFADTSVVYTTPTDIYVSVIDPDVIKVDWYINGELVKSNASGVFPVSAKLKIGKNEVTAHVYDEVIKHAFSDNKNPHPLDLVRKDLDKLQQRLTWQLDYSGNRGRR